jgi:hypothetical protein
VAHRDAWLGAAEIVTGRLLAFLHEILVRLGHCGGVEVEQFVLVASVGIEDPVARNDVVRAGTVLFPRFLPGIESLTWE